ncbi:MAG: DUF1573 domain-containing protein [Candidatus Omnitrophica bacterium]|nr:DUF1573 domain-containing protein [Candidatus Omnitrophota bacterium]
MQQEVRGEQNGTLNFWDFGQIKQGKVVKHVFEFKNDTNSEFNIVSTSASCGCTSSKVDKQSLAPQETANVEVSFNSHGYSGDVEQFVYLTTDAPEKQVTKFRIKANVIK